MDSRMKGWMKGMDEGMDGQEGRQIDAWADR
jgi:hypothetical protein